MISERIRVLREKTGMSARKFAEHIGVKYTTYYGYETGSREPGSDFLILLANHHGVTTDYILGIEKSPVPEKTSTGDERLDGIIKNYEELNEAGKDNLAKHAEHLTYIPEYKKCDSLLSENTKIG